MHMVIPTDWISININLVCFVEDLFRADGEGKSDINLEEDRDKSVNMDHSHKTIRQSSRHPYQ